VVCYSAVVKERKVVVTYLSGDERLVGHHGLWPSLGAVLNPGLLYITLHMHCCKTKVSI